MLSEDISLELPSMSNAIGCIDRRLAFKNSGILCLALIFNLKDLSTTVLYAKKLVKHHESYT